MTVIWLALAAGVLVGYGIGYYRPARRASDWANWKKYDHSLRRHSATWWAAFAILSAENIGWLITHPVKGWHAWQHRNDPPPPRSPALRFDPDWAAKRRAASAEEPRP